MKVSSVNLREFQFGKEAEQPQYVPRPKKTCLHGFPPGLEVIKLEYSIKLKIKHND